jgi:carbonic anhydrase
MTAFATLTDRNRAFAAVHPGERPALEPRLKTVILCCADHRADPAHVLGLMPNEAIVIRNPGGRVTPDFLRDLAVLATVAQTENLSAGYELIVMQHTDCGLSHLSPEGHAEVLASFLGVRRGEVASKHLGDPREAVLSDISLMRDNPMVPGTLVVGGLVYDVDTGHVETIFSPATLRDKRGN